MNPTGSESTLSKLKRDVVWIVNNNLRKGTFPVQQFAKRLALSKEDQYANCNLFTHDVSNIRQMPVGVPIPQVAMRTGYTVFRDGCVCLKTGKEVKADEEVEALSQLEQLKDACCCPRKDFTYDRMECTKHQLPMPCEECMLQFNPYYRGSNLPRRVLTSPPPLQQPPETASYSNKKHWFTR